MDFKQVAYAVGLALFAGISTGIGGLIVIFFKKTNHRILSIMLGFSAGIMIYISFIELYQEAQMNLCESHGIIAGKMLTVLSFFFGIVLMAFINEFIPEPNQPHRNHMEKVTKANSGQLYRTGLFTAIAVTTHNFPEGVATFISGMKSPALGVSIALAIAIHNIPEGIAISVPVYYATKNKKKAFLISLISGLSEPLGAILAALILGPFITDTMFGLIFAAVAGIMVYISLDELLPTAREYSEHNSSILGMVLGMAVMALSVIFLF